MTWLLIIIACKNVKKSKQLIKFPDQSQKVTWNGEILKILIFDVQFEKVEQAKTELKLVVSYDKLLLNIFICLKLIKHLNFRDSKGLWGA